MKNGYILYRLDIWHIKNLRIMMQQRSNKIDIKKT